MAIVKHLHKIQKKYVNQSDSDQSLQILQTSLPAQLLFSVVYSLTQKWGGWFSGLFRPLLDILDVPTFWVLPWLPRAANHEY